MDSSFRGGSPMGPGGFSPYGAAGQRGRGRGGRGRGGGGGGGRDEGFDVNQYAHPSMLEDPWAQLEKQRGRLTSSREGGDENSSSASESRMSEAEFHQKTLSESMIPQVCGVLW